MHKIKALALTGPTASGKTALSIALAMALDAEIISLDSMQIYKYMDIGTAKATDSERAAVPHHMLDFLSPGTPYSAYSYKEDAMRAAEDISLRGRLPLFVGGTGLYLDTLRRRGTSADVPESDRAFTASLLEGASDEAGRIALHNTLRELDPKSAESIHYNNVKRVARAIEICRITGLTKSELDSRAALPDERIDITHITLDFHNRDTLYARCDGRVDLMMREGLVDEVLSLHRMGYLGRASTAGLAIGYKEIIDAKEAGRPPEDATDLIKQATRNYAKRQLTWFRRDKSAIRIYADTPEGTMKGTDELLRECLSAYNK